ncbi:putative porin [Paraburkholderia fungorum]|uniref:porin n=1 Tax=Paraburkholderia fungorum TaxID=134537 RepID=UPI000D049C57|nr:porin [Paraburkholderia fungorum]PRZ55865.1 putative porin [Paraburkholderia fungorum]
MRHLKLCVVGTTLLFSSASFAQSSVTLFGILDEGLNYTSNAGGKSAYQMTSIDLATSRFGLKGQEDLGGGLQAIFDLETGFNVESGTLLYGGRMFGYQAYTGLSSTTFGTLTFGRQFDSIVDVVSPLTANGSWAGFLFSHPYDNDNTDGTYHLANSVKYTSPTFYGFSGTAMIGLSNEAGRFANNRAISAGLSYAAGGLTVAAAYADLNNPGQTAGGSIASDDANFVAGNQKTYGVGVSYGFSSVTIAGIYTHVALQQPVSTVYVGGLGIADGHLTFDNAEFNVKYFIAPDLSVAAMYTYTRALSTNSAGTTSTHWNQIGGQIQYAMSKRTSLYGQAVYQKVSSAAAAGILGFAAIPGSAGVSSNGNQTVVRLGLYHAF